MCIRDRRGVRPTVRRSPVDDRGVHQGPAQAPAGRRPAGVRSLASAPLANRRRFYPASTRRAAPAQPRRRAPGFAERGVGGRRVRSERAPGAAPVGAIRRPQGSSFDERLATRPRRARPPTAATPAGRRLRQRRSAAPPPPGSRHRRGDEQQVVQPRGTAAGARRGRFSRRRRPSRAVAAGSDHGAEGTDARRERAVRLLQHAEGVQVGRRVQVQAREGTRAAARSVSQSKVLNDERATPEVSHRIATGARVDGGAVHLERYETSGHLVSKRRLQRRADRAGDE